MGNGPLSEAQRGVGIRKAEFLGILRIGCLNVRSDLGYLSVGQIARHCLSVFWLVFFDKGQLNEPSKHFDRIFFYEVGHG